MDKDTLNTQSDLTHPTSGRREDEIKTVVKAPYTSIVSEVVRHVEHPEFLEKAQFSGWYRYMPSLLLVGLAFLVVLWQYSEKPRAQEPGREFDRLSAREKATRALAFKFQGEQLFTEASETWDDDESKMEDAFHKYLSAWKILYGGAEYPGKGKLIFDSAECENAVRELPGKINEAWRQSSILNWGEYEGK